MAEEHNNELLTWFTDPEKKRRLWWWANRHARKEIAEEAFRRAESDVLEGHIVYKPHRGAPSTLLYQVIRNKIADIYRRLEREQRAEQKRTLTVRGPEKSTLGDIDLIKFTDDPESFSRCELISPAAAHLLALNIREGLSPVEIAERLGKKHAATYKAIKRAKVRWQAALLYEEFENLKEGHPARLLERERTTIEVARFVARLYQKKGQDPLQTMSPLFSMTAPALPSQAATWVVAQYARQAPARKESVANFFRECIAERRTRRGNANYMSFVLPFVDRQLGLEVIRKEFIPGVREFTWYPDSSTTREQKCIYDLLPHSYLDGSLSMRETAEVHKSFFRGGNNTDEQRTHTSLLLRLTGNDPDLSKRILHAVAEQGDWMNVWFVLAFFRCEGLRRHERPVVADRQLVQLIQRIREEYGQYPQIRENTRLLLQMCRRRLK